MSEKTQTLEEFLGGLPQGVAATASHRLLAVKTDGSIEPVAPSSLTPLPKVISLTDCKAGWNIIAVRPGGKALPADDNMLTTGTVAVSAGTYGSAGVGSTMFAFIAGHVFANDFNASTTTPGDYWITEVALVRVGSQGAYLAVKLPKDGMQNRRLVVLNGYGMTFPDKAYALPAGSYPSVTVVDLATGERTLKARTVTTPGEFDS